MISRIATFTIPKLSTYGKDIKNVITCQTPSYFSEVSMKEARAILRGLKKENPQAYDALRGQINAMADKSGHRLNILFSEAHPGMLEVTIAPKNAATTREFAEEFLDVFRDPENAVAHLKNLKKMWCEPKTLKEGETMMTHIVDPKTNFINELRESLYKLIENAEFRKYAK